MYKIQGADQNEYGPVTAEQVRQWIAEHRLNAQSMARLEGEEGWKPLAQFPEFAASLAPPPPAASAQVPATIAPLSPLARTVPRTNPMALTGLIMGLMTVCFGWCCCYGLPFNILGIIFSSIGLSQINKNPQIEKGRGMAIAGLVLSVAGTILIVIVLLVFGFAFHFDEIMRQIKR